MRSVKAGERAPNMFIEILKGGLLASVISIALIVLYALALWKEILPAESMPIANAVIKVISAAAASLLAVRPGCFMPRLHSWCFPFWRIRSSYP